MEKKGNLSIVVVLLAAALLLNSAGFGLYAIGMRGTGQATEIDNSITLAGSSQRTGSYTRDTGSSFVDAENFESDFAVIELFSSYDVTCSASEDPGTAEVRFLLDGNKFFEKRCSTDNHNIHQSFVGSVKHILKREGSHVLVYEEGILVNTIPFTTGRLKWEGLADVHGPPATYSLTSTYGFFAEGELTTEQAQLADDLAALRALYGNRLEYLEIALQTQLTSDEFVVLMEEYRVLIEESTDARLIEDLNLLRSDFQAKLDSYVVVSEVSADEFARSNELTATEFAELNGKWADTIPVLELSIKALEDKQAAIETQIAGLETEINDFKDLISQLEADLALAEAQNNQAQVDALETQLASLNADLSKTSSDLNVAVEEEREVTKSVQEVKGEDLLSNNNLLILVGFGLLFFFMKKGGKPIAIGY